MLLLLGLGIFRNRAAVQFVNHPLSLHAQDAKHQEMTVPRCKTPGDDCVPIQG